MLYVCHRRELTLAILGLDNAGKTVTTKGLQGGMYAVQTCQAHLLHDDIMHTSIYLIITVVYVIQGLCLSLFE